MAILESIRRYLAQPLVRPWALVAPVLVLVLCLPVLRPLRQPDMGQLPDGERASLAMVRAIVEGHTLRLENVPGAGGRWQFRARDGIYAATPPMQAALAAPVYWLLRQRGLSFQADQVMVRYLLVLLCVTLPVALSAALVYRLGRLFLLARPVRVGLALLVILPTGLVVYATSFSPHAQSAVLLLATAACLSHVAVCYAPARNLPWLGIGGACAALAACLHPAALVVMSLFPAMILWMRWGPRLRLAGILLYAAGALAVLSFNAWLLFQMTGEVHLLPPANIVPASAVVAPGPMPPVAPVRPEPADDEESDTSVVERVWSPVSAWMGRVLDGILGEQGVLSHFPAVALGVLGASLALRRHWAETTKALAGISLLAVAMLLGGYWIWVEAGPREVYGPGWIAPVLPLVMVWSGAWLRPRHRKQSWVLATAACAVSLAAAGVGMLDVPPARGYKGYSLAEASIRLIQSPPAAPAGEK